MPDAPKTVELEASWVGAEDLPVQFANAFTGTAGPNAVFLTIGSSVPPAIESEEDIAAISFVPIKPIARLALAPKGLDDLIEILEQTRQNYQSLLKAMGGSDQT